MLLAQWAARAVPLASRRTAHAMLLASRCAARFAPCCSLRAVPLASRLVALAPV